MTEQNQRYRIALIGKKDAFYTDRKTLIGKEGTAEIKASWPGNWVACNFTFDKFIPAISMGRIGFYRVLLKKL